MWCLLDTDDNYTEAQRDVYRTWLQTSALALRRGQELLALGVKKGEASKVAPVAAHQENGPCTSE